MAFSAKQKIGLATLLTAAVIVLYGFELSKIRTLPEASLPSIDTQKNAETATALWNDFYRVHVQLIDGQSARFTIPETLKRLEGQRIALRGIATFYEEGCQRRGDRIAVDSFILVPSTGIADSCELLPEMEMRWRILVTLRDPWALTREDMIVPSVLVKGRFRIDTESHPYDAAFFIDDANVRLSGEGTAEGDNL